MRVSLVAWGLRGAPNWCCGFPLNPQKQGTPQEKQTHPCQCVFVSAKLFGWFHGVDGQERLAIRSGPGLDAPTTGGSLGSGEAGTGPREPSAICRAVCTGMIHRNLLFARWCTSWAVWHCLVRWHLEDCFKQDSLTLPGSCVL